MLRASAAADGQAVRLLFDGIAIDVTNICYLDAIHTYNNHSFTCYSLYVGISMHYAVLYDFSDHNPIPLLLLLVILYLFIVVFAIRAANHGRLIPLMAGSRGGGWMLVLGVGLIVSIIASGELLTYAIYFHALSQGQYQTVEGSVEEFTPRPIHGHGVAGFTVDGIRFTYVATDLTGALQQPQPPFQPLQNGRYVRISYTRDYTHVYVAEPTLYDPKILKVEILQKPEPPPVTQPNNRISCITPITQQPNPRLQPTALPCVQDRPFVDGTFPGLPTPLSQGVG